MDWSSLIFSEDDPARFIEAQSPVPRPDPVPRPGAIERPEPRRQPAPRPVAPPASPPAGYGRLPRPMPQQPTPDPVPQPPAAAQPEQPPAAPRNWSDMIFTPDQQQQTETPQQPAAPASAEPFPGYVDPKSETWGKWLWNNVKGRVDPRYGNLPSLQDVLIKENTANEQQDRSPYRQIIGATPFAVTGQQQADVAKEALGDRFQKMEQDAYGAHVVTFKGADGKPVRAYVNRPGLEGEDVANGIMQAVPYVLTGGAAGTAVKGAGMGIKALTAGSVAGTTSLGNDVAAQAFGAQDAPDPVRAAAVAGLGAAGEAAAPFIGRLVNRFWKEPKLYDKAAGTLTAEGEKAAAAVGVDPAILTRELADQLSKELAGGGDLAGRTIFSKNFGIDVTKGQVTKNPSQLLQEKSMAYGNYGDTAQNTIKQFYDKQKMQIEAAARGDTTAPNSVAALLNPQRSAQGTSVRDLGGNLRGGLDEAMQVARADEAAAWSKVGKITADQSQRDAIPQFIAPKIGNLPVDDKLTPAARAMADDLDRFMSGAVPGNAPKSIGVPSVPDVIDMRRRLFGTMRSAQNETDRAAAKAVYEGYGDWIKETFPNNPDLRVATDITRELNTIFGAGARGATPGSKIVSNIMSDTFERTPELIMRELFPANSKAAPKAGSVEGLQKIKSGLERYLTPERATEVWADLKLAAWKGLIEQPNGQLHTPLMMSNRITESLSTQRSVWNTLITADERKKMQHYAAAMREIHAKDPNGSGTATSNQFYVGQFGKALLPILFKEGGPVSTMFQMFMRGTGLRNVVGAAPAARAVNPVMRSQTPMVGPYTGAAAAQAVPDDILQRILSDRRQ